MKRPRLNILRTFAAAGEQLSFSLAAEELKISQAAVSQQIRQLEAYLQTPLFLRHHRRLSLTPTGQAYFEAVHEALDRLDSVTDQLFPALQQQAVTLRCTASVATLWLAPEIKSFRRLHPEIELRITTLDQSHAKDKAVPCDLEIFISAETSGRADTTRLLTATIVPVCSAKLFANRKRPRHAAELLRMELIHLLGYDDDWHRWFRSNGVRAEVPGGLSVDGSLIAIEAAQRGDGIMLGRRPFIDRLLAGGELVEVFDRPICLQTDYYLRRSPRSAAREDCRIVADWLFELAAGAGDQVAG